MTQVLERSPEFTEQERDVREMHEETRRASPIKIHAAKGLWNQNGGFEYNLVLIVLLLVVGLVGPGMYSFDRRLPFAMPRPYTFIAALVITALVIGFALVSSG